MAGMGQHNVRVGDDLWRAAMARARAEGVTVTDVIARSLAEYAAPGAPPGFQVIPDDRIPPGTAVLMPPGSEPQAIVWAEPHREPLVPEFVAARTEAEFAGAYDGPREFTDPPKRPRKVPRAEPEPKRAPCCRHCHPDCDGSHTVACTKPHR